MLIARWQQIAGIDAVAARALCRAARNPGLQQTCDYPEIRVGKAVADAVDAAGITVSDAVARLVDAGYLVRDDNPHWSEWNATLDGAQLAKARIGTPIPRARAQRSVDALLARVVANNDDPDRSYTVLSVDVFGSFTDPDRDTVGDADVSIIYDRTIDADEFMRRTEMATDGKNVSFPAELFYLAAQWRKMIAARDRYLDIQFAEPTQSSPIPPGATVQRIYTYKP